MPLLDDISAYLASAGLGLVEGTNLFKSRLPDSPDLAVAIFEWGGQPNEKTMASHPGQAILERPSFQVLVRGDRQNLVSGSYSAARVLAESIYRKLDGYSGTLSGVAYQFIEAAAPPSHITTDDNDRPHIGCDYDCMKALG